MSVVQLDRHNPHYVDLSPAAHSPILTILSASAASCWRKRIGHPLEGRKKIRRTIWKPDAIERQLAHAERNNVRAAYNHAQYLPERTAMMQHWADYLDVIAAGKKVIAGKFGKAA